MQIAILNNGEIKSIGDFRSLFPYTVFPDTGPSNEWLAANSCKKVNLFKPHDQETQVLTPSSPYVEGEWVYTVTVRSKTPEETEATIASRAANVRAERDRRLSASDWTQVLDAPVDRTAWVLYRQALRDLPEQPGFPDVSFPLEPGSQQGGV
jgi:hypothetical protein